MTASPLLFLDSANLDDVGRVAESGVVFGVTTNPSIMAREAADSESHLAKLLRTFTSGPVCHQLVSRRPDAAFAEVERIEKRCGEHAPRLVFKLPAQPWLYPVGTQLNERGRAVAFTAVYSLGQVLCAAAAGARWVIPYVDRAARLEPDAPPLLLRLRSYVPPPVRVLAASLKTSEQALEALQQGADAVTAPWSVLEHLVAHPHTDTAVADFRTVQCDS